MNDAIGWGSSIILILTISAQVTRQWRSGTSKGVSSWLFVGQFVASTGFCIYSALVHDRVFTVTNGLLALLALTGFIIVRVHRRREADDAATRGSSAPRRARATASQAL
jgi:MtN3 and saliva related transmembrane protein